MISIVLFSITSCYSQDSEQKDICHSFAVYYKTKITGFYSDFATEKLAKRLKEIHTIRDLNINPHKGLIFFNVSSCINLKEQQLRRLLEDAGVIPIEIKFSSDPSEIFEEEQYVNF